MPYSINKKGSGHRVKKVILYIISAFFGVLFLFSINNIATSYRTMQHYVVLSQSFIDGKITMPSSVEWGENKYTSNNLSFFNGSYYWPLGVYPAVFLIPFVWLGNFFHITIIQGYLSVPFLLLCGYFIWYIAIKNKYSQRNAFIYATTFCLGTPLFSVAVFSVSWSFPHLVATTFILGAVSEYFGKRRPLIVGFLAALAMASRPMILAGIICLIMFEYLRLSKDKVQFRDIRVIIASYILPVFVIGFAMGAYNIARFGSFFEQGYSYTIIIEKNIIKENLYGYFDIRYILRNIYRYTIGIKNYFQGMGILITSPFFISMFFLRYKDKISKAFLIASAVVFIPLLFWFSAGGSQIGGMRFGLDFLPFLFVALILANNESSITKKKVVDILFLLSIIFTLTIIYIHIYLI